MVKEHIKIVAIEQSLEEGRDVWKTEDLQVQRL